MMIMSIFSQLAMEIYAYNFAVNKNMENANISYIKKYMENKQKIAERQASDKENSDKEVSNKEITNEKKKETTVNAEEKVAPASSVISFIMPVKGGITTSVYGDNVSRTSPHKGHDWAVNTGTKVVASADGIVEKAYYSDSYGYNVLVNHGNGMETRYAHLSSLSVKTGERVKQNQLLGLSGSTGQSTGPHLHFEVIKNGRRVNPLIYVK